MKLHGRKMSFLLLWLATGLLVFGVVLHEAGQDSEETGSGGNVGDPPSTGEEGEKTSPEAPEGLTFGGRPGRVGLIQIASEPGQKQSPFTVGIVEANGNLVPTAHFDGVSWSPPNLVEDWKRGRPGVRSLGEWTLWYENPGPTPEDPHRSEAWIDRLSPVRIGIAINGLVGSEMRCSRNLALVTDAGDRRKSLIECDHCCPEPKRGIATTSKSPPGLVERLDPEGEESRRLTARVLDTFNELENKAFEETHHHRTGETLAEYTEPRLSAEKRMRLPLAVVVSAFRLQEANSTLYYIEMSRDYYRQLREEFPANAYIQGWVRATADELVWLTQSFAVTDPEPKALSWYTPIVFWRRATGFDLLVSHSEWEGERYGILTVKNGTVNDSVYMRYRP